MQQPILDLSIPAVRYAVETCEDNHNYYFGIIVSDDKPIISVLDVCLDFVDWMKYDPQHTVVKDDSAVFHLKNGSKIDIVRESDTRRSLRWHACLVDRNVDKKSLHKTIANLVWQYK